MATLSQINISNKIFQQLIELLRNFEQKMDGRDLSTKVRALCSGLHAKLKALGKSLMPSEAPPQTDKIYAGKTSELKT